MNAGHAVCGRRAFKEDELAVMEAGMQAHIAKPVDVGVLLRTLASVLHMEDV